MCLITVFRRSSLKTSKLFSKAGTVSVALEILHLQELMHYVVAVAQVVLLSPLLVHC